VKTDSRVARYSKYSSDSRDYTEQQSITLSQMIGCSHIYK